MKIAEVSEKTGVSRELIHHYLRQGLLPRSTARAVYDERQIRLLRQIKTLRDDHHLPLDTIRGVFDYFGFDPGRIEAVTEADSLARRLTRLASAGEVLSSRSISAAQLLSEVGLSAERLAAYVQARLVTPVSVNGSERYSAYDAKVVALCEHGVRLGMDFESLRTVASYVRVAYELEHADLLYGTGGVPGDGPRQMADVVARLEVITSFIQSLLQSLISRHVHEFHRPRAEVRAPLDGVVYRPSATFLRRHGLEADQRSTAERLGARSDDPRSWRQAARTLLHAGRYNEAVFFLEKGLERLEDDAPLRPLYGRALLLAGHRARADEWLSACRADPLSQVFHALLRIAAPRSSSEDPTGPDAARCRQLVDDALARTEDNRAACPPVRYLGGWLLTALPEAFRDTARGVTVLAEVLDGLGSEPPLPSGLPGEHERHRINAAYLLFDARGRVGADADLPTAEALRSLVCRLDPGCSFAEAVYLQPDEPPETLP